MRAKLSFIFSILFVYTNALSADWAKKDIGFVNSDFASDKVHLIAFSASSIRETVQLDVILSSKDTAQELQAFLEKQGTSVRDLFSQTLTVSFPLGEYKKLIETLHILNTFEAIKPSEVLDQMKDEIINNVREVFEKYPATLTKNE